MNAQQRRAKVFTDLTTERDKLKKALEEIKMLEANSPEERDYGFAESIVYKIADDALK